MGKSSWPRRGGSPGSDSFGSARAREAPPKMQPRSHEDTKSARRKSMERPSLWSRVFVAKNAATTAKSALAPGDEVYRHPHLDFDRRAVQDRRIELPLTHGLDCGAVQIGMRRRR